jgi:hypothetical protein
MACQATTRSFGRPYHTTTTARSWTPISQIGYRWCICDFYAQTCTCCSASHSRVPTRRLIVTFNA